MAIMLLVEQNLLAYDDRLRAYLPDLPVWGDAIRIHHVLHHTAGLPDYFALLTPHHADDTTPQFARDVSNVTNAVVLRLLGRQAGLVFPAGESYKYSNMGYVLLALLVEALSV